MELIFAIFDSINWRVKADSNFTFYLATTCLE